jgi:hypothetical protein
MSAATAEAMTLVKTSSAPRNFLANATAQTPPIYNQTNDQNTNEL